MSIDVKYTAIASATGGREGSAQSDDGRFEAKLSTPKELGGAGGDGTNPEQLFAAGYAACFIGALKVAGQQLKLKVPEETKVTATVGIGPRAAGGFGITTDLIVDLPGSIAMRRSAWSIPRTRSAPIRTRRAAMSTSGWRSPDRSGDRGRQPVDRSAVFGRAIKEILNAFFQRRS